MIVLNAQGFLKHKEEIEQMINEWKPEIACLTETHITEEINDFEINIKNYNLVRCNTNNSRTGGVLTFIKGKIHYEEIKNKSIEQNVWLSTIKISGKRNGDIIICNTYHSPSASDGRFIDIITDECENILDMGHIFLVGDFNIDFSKKNGYTERLERNLLCLGLKQQVKTPTRITESSKTIIDLVFTNFYVKTEVLMTPKITDHQIIRLDLDTGYEDNSRLMEIVTRDYGQYNEENFTEVLSEKVQSIKYYEENDINRMADKLVTVITQTMNEIAPLTKKVIKEKWIDKPWITNKVKIAISNRDRAYRTKDWDVYRQCRNKVVQAIRKSKQEYYENSIDKYKTDSNKMWKTMKELIGTKKQEGNNRGIVFDGVKYTEAKEIAEKFNVFFISSIDKIVEDIGILEEQEKNEISAIKFDEFKKVGGEEIGNIINNLRNKKGSNEGITPDILKQTWKAESNLVITLINKSLEEGIFPENWKTTTIVPIQKVKGSTKAEEYRPINILPVYEKVLELVVKEQLLEFLNINSILAEEQSGFRKGLSCEAALQKTLIEWRAILDKSEMIGVMFVDFKRAFETVSRKILLKKLRSYGIGGQVLKWFESYLTDRKQKIKYMQEVSGSRLIEHGVPQGSVLGPLLFIVYVNDIVKELRYSACSMFADDMIIYISDDNADEIEFKINYDMKKIDKWLKQNSLKINIKKTNFMLIRDPRKQIGRNRCNIVIIDEDIEEISETKYLGVIIDENLSFNRQAAYAAKKVAKKVNFLYRIGKHISMYTRLTIYKTIISPHFEYCSTLMLNMNAYSMQMLQRAQNRAMRAILGCNRYTPVIDMLEALCFMSIKQRMVFNVCLMVHKIVNGIGPQYLNRLVRKVSERHNYNTRSRNEIEVAYCRTKIAEKSLMYSGIKWYNMIPEPLKDERNLRNFKRGLSQYVKSCVEV